MLSSELSRRRFLAQLGQMGAAAATLLTVPERVFGQSGKAMLQASDFTFAGGVKLPHSSNGISTSYGQGLTHRYVNGQLRFLSTTYNPGPQYDVFEMAAPSP